MTFAELAGNMWDDAGALVLERVKKRGNTLTTISEEEKAKWIKATRAGRRRLDQAGQGQGPRRRQADRAGQGAGGQVRQGVSVCRAAARSRPSLRAARRRVSRQPGEGSTMSDAGAAAQADAQPPLVERLSGFDRAARRPAVAVRGLAGRLQRAGPLAQGRAIGRGVAAVRHQLGPVNGDFEMVQMATAIAIFTFLPYCQARRGNIVVDTFTSWLPRRALNACIDAVLGPRLRRHDGLLAACLVVGTLEHYRSGQTTMLLQIIVWPAHRHLARRWLFLLTLRRAGDGGQAACRGGHERSCRSPPSASAPCCC